jgi:hypothetical protein
MGELDEKPFVLSCKERYGEDAEMKALARKGMEKMLK